MSQYGRPAWLHPMTHHLLQRSLLRIPVALTALLLAGCVSMPEQLPVPSALETQAVVPGYPQIRFCGSARESGFLADFHQALRAARPAGSEGLAVLALSGGGANGAFCAGLLGGWSEAGTRPEFQVVTGVSTGALAAPFAFLGPRYDDRLRTAYTQMRAHDIYHLHVMRSAFRLLRVDAVADTEPMTRTVARLTDQGMLDAIAAEHRRGRRLYVCTTELVSGRAVYWSLSAIAASGRPGSLELFQKLLVASSSIPVAFPPQYIGVEAGGRSYTEMHVDGGLSSQVFLDLQGARAELPATTARGPLALTAYIIRNAKVVPAYDSLRPELLAIASRSLQALIRRQGNADLNRIYEQAGREDTVFRLAVIPADFPMEHRGAIDTAYMARLFELGRKMAARGYPWVDRPPAYDQGPVRSNGTEAVGVR